MSVKKKRTIGPCRGVIGCIVVVTGFLPSPLSRFSLSSPPSQVHYIKYDILLIR